MPTNIRTAREKGYKSYTEHLSIAQTGGFVNSRRLALF